MSSRMAPWAGTIAGKARHGVATPEMDPPATAWYTDHRISLTMSPVWIEVILTECAPRFSREISNRPVAAGAAARASGKLLLGAKPRWEYGPPNLPPSNGPYWRSRWRTVP